MLQAEERSLVLGVQDDGRGFDPATAFTAPPGRFGLAGIRDRITAEGGSFTVRTSPGSGCSVAALV